MSESKGKGKGVARVKSTAKAAGVAFLVANGIPPKAAGWLVDNAGGFALPAARKATAKAAKPTAGEKRAKAAGLPAGTSLGVKLSDSEARTKLDDKKAGRWTDRPGQDNAAKWRQWRKRVAK